MTQTDKYGENPQQIKVNGKRIPLDPKTNYAEFEFTRAKWSC